MNIFEANTTTKASLTIPEGILLCGSMTCSVERVYSHQAILFQFRLIYSQCVKMFFFPIRKTVKFFRYMSKSGSAVESDERNQPLVPTCIYEPLLPMSLVSNSI